MKKISEKLSIKNKYSKTKFKKIYSIDEDEISNKKINLLIDYLNKKLKPQIIKNYSDSLKNLCKMIYGLDQNILQSPISLILSIILSLGVINFGTLIQKLAIEKFKIIDFKVNIFSAR